MRNIITKRKLKIIGVITGILILICMFTLFGYLYKEYHRSKKITNEQLDELLLDKCTKLMIVAHPDDDTIWGGSHLLEGDYFVVCLSHKNDERSEEFANAMGYSKNKCLMLDYPDKVLNRRSYWEYIESNIAEDIKTVLDYKEWDSVVTHNPDGEYGHQHHKMLSKIATKVYDENDYKTKMYYFGKYYAKGEDIESVGMTKIDDKSLEKKKEMLKYYCSQDFIDEKFGHMYPYEDWQIHTK